jgi:hypothetical protein
MNCEEFQEVLPEVIDGGRSPEQDWHLKSCTECRTLVEDLYTISQQAKMLRESEEPSPQLWTAIQAGLEREGLIALPERQPVLVLKRTPRWNPAWLLPIAASVFVLFGVLRYQRNDQPVNTTAAISQPAASTQAILTLAPQDEQIMTTLASYAPTMRAKYETDLQNVNAYIRDAQDSVHSNPNDALASQYLMDAYEQKAMLYQMVLDRPLQ